MDTSETVVAVVSLILLYGTIREYLKYRTEYLKYRTQTSNREIEQLRQQVQELQHRVEVLESIIASPELIASRERMRQIQAETAKSLPSPHSISTPQEPQAQR